MSRGVGPLRVRCARCRKELQVHGDLRAYTCGRCGAALELVHAGDAWFFDEAPPERVDSPRLEAARRELARLDADWKDRRRDLRIADRMSRPRRSRISNGLATAGALAAFVLLLASGFLLTWDSGSILLGVLFLLWSQQLGRAVARKGDAAHRYAEAGREWMRRRAEVRRRIAALESEEATAGTGSAA